MQSVVYIARLKGIGRVPVTIVHESVGVTEVRRIYINPAHSYMAIAEITREIGNILAGLQTELDSIMVLPEFTAPNGNGLAFEK